MIGRILRSADFERVLGSPSRARSSHFAVHHVAASPILPGKKLSTDAVELSTGDAPDIHMLVDEGRAQALPQGCWLGSVVPKRHARRAVTRTLLKRQIRAAFVAQAAAEEPLLPGLWVVRLRAPFDIKQFPSASSEALRTAARVELAQLFERARAPQREQQRPARARPQA
ncbi:ribonuclease P protein component [Paucibacter sp. M5-1]|uniref:ribonuclease P protein component n=1 Tax=Paucibacter sp. M5-1 TaxID=3015998 RepID=UPI0022B86053|nr:ribonuclease P protein component [Paucibacter sp. M5-1]MCZ7881936.1 ribonuclease P protein component [Paucibacter sp. M5-1]